MPPRPSSLPFRVGTDIVRINRIKGILNGGKTNQPGDPKKLASFLIRIMTPWERHVFYKRFADQDRALVAGIFGTCQYLAGR
jgi:phosphopantetheinyl transferase (holo-ACP synthase)